MPRFQALVWLVLTGFLAWPGVLPAACPDDPAPATANLLKNPGFSDAKDGKPASWRNRIWSGEPQFSLDQAVGRSSAPSVRIQSRTGADASWSIQVQLQPHTQYRFSAWVRTENLEKGSGQGALLNIHELQLESRSPAIEGTTDWQQLVTEFDSGERTSVLLNLLFGGWGASTGTVWFDDVELVELARSVPVMAEDDAIKFYEERIKPVFAEHCASCHADDPEDLSGGLGITGRASLLRGGESGPAVNLEDPEQSLLYKAVNHEVFEMPPGEKLPKEQIEDLRLWLRMGMPWTPGEETDHGPVEKEPLVNEAARRWWAFQPPVRSEPPAVETPDWCRSEIDRFVLARLESAGLQPAPLADRRTLIRRASYDLTGLPPSLEEVEAFANDPDPAAYEKLVDRLLASPHYGEKWGRHWLDLVRYAESNSFERDGTKPYVWRYRDYVIRAFNNDKPYNRFLMEQLAGDELPDRSVETVTATGYYRLGQWDDEPADPLQARFDDLDDILSTTSQTMLGMTINCARCHDHKIDPIPQADYYRLLAFFSNIRRYGIRSPESVLDASVVELPIPASEAVDEPGSASGAARLPHVEHRIAELETKARSGMSGVTLEDFQYEMRKLELMEAQVDKSVSRAEVDEYRRLWRERKRLMDSDRDRRISLLAVKEQGPERPENFVMIRGNAHVQGSPVQPGFPEVFGLPDPEIVPQPDQQTSGARLALARWIADPANPMTARVMANRIWQYHFGEGLVRTSSDYGYQGSKPTHPELLDWLADEFVRNGWSIKHLHRQIMTSATYRMSGTWNEQAAAVDPENELLWRYSLRRLTAEEVRDSLLAATGKLNLDAMYGRSIYPPLPEEVLAGQSMPGDGWGHSPPEQANRRSIYIHVKRSLQVPLLASHDMSDTDFACPVRFVTTQPTQALNMMNSAFTGEAARDLAERVRALHPDDREQQWVAAFGFVTQRAPTAEELQRCRKLVDDWQSNDGLNEEQARQQLCLLFLNLNEFMYLD